MKKYCLFLVLAVVFNQALSRSVRDKRQAPDEDDLDNRYGFVNQQQPTNQRPFLPGSGTELFPFPNPFPGFPDFGQQRPAQGQFPGQNQGQFPGQGQNQGQFPNQNQGQFPGQGQNQGQFPGQGQNQGQFPGQGQNQGQNQGQFPGQGQNQGQFPGQGQNQGQFPGQGQNQGQFPGQGQNQGQQGQNQGQQGQNQGQQGQNQGQQGQNQGQQPAGTTVSPSAAIIQQCVRACPVTSEYNPVCGSNNVTYFNPGRLICAQNCGETVTATRQSPCPVPPSAVPIS